MNTSEIAASAVGRGCRAALLLAAAALFASCGGGQRGGEDANADPEAYNAILTSDGGQVSVEGTFEATKGYLSQGKTVLRAQGTDSHSARYRLQVPRAGHYEVFAWWPQAATGAGLVRTELRHTQGLQEMTVDQSTLGGQWNSMGVFALSPDIESSLTFSATGAARLYADAVRVQWVGKDRPALRLAQESLPIADKDDPYTAQLSVWGGMGRFTYQLMGGQLPDGLTLDAGTGVISGVPAETGSFALEILATEESGRSTRGQVLLDVVLSNDTPSSVPARPFKLERDRKSALGTTPGSGASLGALPAIVSAMPEGSWAKVNLNQFSDAWVPADLRPMYMSGNPTPAKIITAWSSFAWDSNRGNLLLYGGGHANYRGNEVYLWRAATQLWERASLPSEMRQDALGNWNAIDSADAAPASAHTYDNSLFFPAIDRMVVLGGAADSNGGHYLSLNASASASRPTGLYLFDPARAHPDRVGGSTGSHVQRVAPWPEIVGGDMWSNREMYLNTTGTQPPGESFVNSCSAYSRVGGKDVGFVRTGKRVYRFTINNVNNPSTDVWEKVGVKWYGSGTKATCSFDPEQQILLRTATQTVPFVYWPMVGATPSTRDVTVVPADPTGTFFPALASGAVNIANCGLEFDPTRRHYKLWCGGGGVWQVTPPATVSATGWSVAPVPMAGTAMPDPTVANGVLGKWKYIENLDVFMALQDSVQGNIWIYKPVGWVDPGTGGGTNTPPTVSLAQPGNGSSYAAGTTIEMSATAADIDGSITKVEFLAGSVTLGESTSAPYAFAWSGAPVGTHLITARATDNSGATSTSAVASISVTATVNAPPTVNLLSPSAGAVFALGAPIGLQASASDSDGVVQRVEFYAGVVKLGEVTSSPYAFNWTTAPAGPHVLSAIAYDDDGTPSVPSSVSVTVSPGSVNAPPTVNLLSPSDGAVFAAGAPIAMQAAASDSDGTVQKVEFYAGIVKLGETTSSPYAFTWTTAPVGPQVLSAIAYDDDGAPSAPSSVSVTVSPGSGGTPTTVTLQRGSGAGTAIADTYLSSYSKTRNYGTADALLDLSQYNILVRAAIFQSEGGPVPNGSTIESAQLSFYKWSSYAMTYGVHRVLLPWSESTSTWNDRLPGTPWAAPGGKVVDVDYAGLAEANASVGYEPGWIEFDITAHVQTLSSTVVAVNNGWRLQPVAGATSSLKRLYSSEYAANPAFRPKLVITYR